MLAYHGTVAGNLHILRPFASPHSNLDYPCVYLSTSKALASIYIWNKPYKWMTFEIGEDGVPVYKESFENGLEEFYKGVPGYIYTCSGEFVFDPNTGIRHALVSGEPVPVSSVDVVRDAYEHILRYEAEGLLRIDRYTDLTDEQRRKDQNMVLNAIRRLDLLKGNHPLSAFVAQKFPEWWRQAASNEP